MKTINQIESLNIAKKKETKSKEESDAELLEEHGGIGWSKLVFEEIEWRLGDARKELIDHAKSNSQWRSLIQTCFIIMATISVGLVWMKLNSVA